MKGIDILDPLHITRSLAENGMLGILANEVSNDQEDDEEEKRKKPSYMKKGGKVSSASSRGDGCAQRGKTRGKFV